MVLWYRSKWARDLIGTPLLTWTRPHIVNKSTAKRNSDDYSGGWLGVAQHPFRFGQSDQLMQKRFYSCLVLPPIGNVKVRILGGGHIHLNAQRKYLLENVARPTGVIIRGDDHNVMPALLNHKAPKRLCFVQSVACVVPINLDCGSWHAAIGQITLDQFADAGIGTHHAPAGDNQWCAAFVVQISGSCGARADEIVIAQHNERIGLRCGIVHDPTITDGSEDWAAHKYTSKTKSNNAKTRSAIIWKKNSAAFAISATTRGRFLRPSFRDPARAIAWRQFRARAD